MRRIALPMLMMVVIVAACGRPEPSSTPLPTKAGTVGRVNQGLEQADQDAAKRREQLERAGAGSTEGAEDKPTKSISAGY